MFWKSNKNKIKPVPLNNTNNLNKVSFATPTKKTTKKNNKAVKNKVKKWLNTGKPWSPQKVRK